MITRFHLQWLIAEAALRRHRGYAYDTATLHHWARENGLQVWPDGSFTERA